MCKVALRLIVSACGLIQRFPSTLVSIRPIPENPMKHSAIEPTIRNMWLETHGRHEESLLGASPEVVFVGDSLTDLWVYQPSWTHALAKYRPVNLGIGGDRTQHLLWRLQRLKLPPARLYSLLIGTNNIGYNSPEEIADGIRACRDEIRRQVPGAIIVIQHLLPRSPTRSDPNYQQVLAVNRLIPGLVKGTGLVEADFSPVFQVEGERHLNYAHVSADHVHFTAEGYAAWADAIVPFFDELLQ